MSKYDLQKASSEAMRRALGPFARAILTVTPQGNFAVPVGDQYAGWELREKGSYAPEELNNLRMLCRPTTRLLVVGAHIGALAIPLAKMCLDVVAIEANPQTFELLTLNVALNNVTNMRLIAKAASNRVEQIEFLMNRVNTGGSKRRPVQELEEFVFDNPQRMNVDAAPLDDLLPGENFNVILMDVEGSEYFALQGMQRILASAEALQVEFFPHHLKCVAGASVADFLGQISPHFQSMYLSRRGTVLKREEFLPTLTEMFDRNEHDDGLIFLKLPAEKVKINKQP